MTSPVAVNALLAEIMPTKHRGWCLVLLGGIGTIGGYYATSELSAVLQPHFGWRIMWLIGFPTGLILIGLSPLFPESARFLLEKGRVAGVRLRETSFSLLFSQSPSTAAVASRQCCGNSTRKEKVSVQSASRSIAWGTSASP